MIACQAEFEEYQCGQVGDHLCEPRWRRFAVFSKRHLSHVKGELAGKPLVWARWQIDELVKPVFGQVRWSDEFHRYIRQYKVVYSETARKSGKTTFLAACLLYLMCAEGQMAAECYGAARTKGQAAIVFNIARLMVRNSLVLSRKLKVVDYLKRIVHPGSESFYACIASDDDDALGQDPHALICDEIVAWRSGQMWASVRTGMGSGARAEPLMIAATTPGPRMATFAHQLHSQMANNESDHIYTFMRNLPYSQAELDKLWEKYPDHPNLPVSTDPFDERNWYWCNPGLGTTVMLSALRQEAEEAKVDPFAEHNFRVYRCAQWVSSAFSYLAIDQYDRLPRAAILHKDRPVAFFGLDLSARTDLTSVCVLLPNEDNTHISLSWKHWITEDALDDLRGTGPWEEWVEDSWLEPCEGSLIDYDRVFEVLQELSFKYSIRTMDVDEWCLPEDNTEVLTRSGWKTVGTLRLGDETIGYNSETGRSEWTTITDINRFKNVKVTSYANTHWGFECTDNHRWVTARGIKETKNLNTKDVLLTASEIDGDKLRFDAELAGFLFGDGSIYTNRCSVELKRREKIDYLSSLGYEGKPTKRGTSKYWIPIDDLVQSGFSKTDPMPFVLSLNGAEARAFLRGLVRADGHERNGNTRISQVYGARSEAINVLCYLAGYRPQTAIYEQHSNAYGTKPIAHGQPVNPKSHWNKFEKTGERVTDVWCPTTDLGTWTAKQGNRVFLTGNSTMPVIKTVMNAMSLRERQIFVYKNTFDRMSPGMTMLRAMIKAGSISHNGDPVARYAFECLEARQAPYNRDLVRPEKPDRAGPARIDGAVTSILAINSWLREKGKPQSAYRDHGLVMLR